MGSGTFGLPVLEAVRASRHSIAAVVTAVDKPQGRGKILTPSPIKIWAQSHGIPAVTPLKINTPESIAELRALNADAFVVASYGALLSRAVLDLPARPCAGARACINVHPSLLPKYRGASPVVQAVLDGETRTGMTIMAMADALDAGDILLQEAVEIGADENARELTDRLAALGGRMTVQALDLIEAGRASHTPQDSSRATYCKKFKKENSVLDWNQPARQIHNHVRALVMWPGSVTQWKNRTLKILETRLHPDCGAAGKPGEVLELSASKGIRVQAGDGSVWILKVQPEGSRPMDHRDFVNGSSIKPGQLFL